MSGKIQKIYCFADESGQDTKGDIFLVSVVLKDSEELPQLYKFIEQLEIDSGKNKQKWHKASFVIRKTYLLGLLNIKELASAIFYSTYRESKGFIPLIALTIAKSILSQNYGDYSATIVIDGLKETEVEYARHELKQLRIKYRKIRGMKDEQDALLRLADSMAGFLRDYKEGFKYAETIFKKFTEARIIREI